MASYLITGSSRGIGLELVKQLAARPPSEVHLVIATARSDNPEGLKQLVDSSGGRVKVVKLDVESTSSISQALKEVESLLSGRGLDVLYNNAGVMPFTPKGLHTMSDLDSVFHTNVTSVHNVTAAFLPLLKKGVSKTVINVSTTLGSLALTPKFALFPVPAYKISKAALNMLTVQYSLELGKEGFKFVAISPGWVKTDLGGNDRADLTVEQCGKAVLAISDRAEKDSTLNGTFQNVHVPGWEENPGLNQYDGKTSPW